MKQPERESMVSDREAARVLRFVRDQLRGEPDLSKLSLGILKKRYLALEGLESLNPETRNYMKQVVEEELMKMQDNDKNGGEQETKKPQNKRKREKENDEGKSGAEEEDECRAKKSRCQSSSSSESEDDNGCKTGVDKSEKEDQSSSGSEDTVGKVKKSQQKTSAKQTQHKNIEDSSDEDISESGKEGDESNGGDSPKEGMKKKDNTKSDDMKGSSGLSPGKKNNLSGEEDESETNKENDKISCNESSDDNEKDEKVPVQKKNNETDSDSSSLTSLEEDQNTETENNNDDKKKKNVKKERESTRGEKEDNKTVVRLKRYIALCGVKRNYKKLLSGCRSVRSMVTVLKKELEDLGVHGQPSVKKCKSVRMKREEAQELAELDVSNIIATRGRPKRSRAASAVWEQHDPLSSTYKRTLHSGSDSDQEHDKSKGQRSTRDWANLQGIISDDADSD